MIELLDLMEWDDKHRLVGKAVEVDVVFVNEKRVRVKYKVSLH